MLAILTKKISTVTGIIVILAITFSAGWLVFRQYDMFMKARFDNLELEIFER